MLCHDIDNHIAISIIGRSLVFISMIDQLGGANLSSMEHEHEHVVLNGSDTLRNSFS